MLPEVILAPGRSHSARCFGRTRTVKKPPAHDVDHAGGQARAATLAGSAGHAAMPEQGGIAPAHAWTWTREPRKLGPAQHIEFPHGRHPHGEKVQQIELPGQPGP